MRYFPFSVFPRVAARLGRIVGAFAIISWSMQPAWAGNDIRAADNAMSLEIGATDLDYGEILGGSTLDTEKGWLPTATLGFGLLANNTARGLFRNLYLHLDLTGSFGTTDYNGALCDVLGNCVPATANTNDQIYNVSTQIGRGLPFGETIMLIPYAQFDYRYWSRQLTGSGAYGEVYTNWAALGGVMGQFALAPRWVLSVSGAAGTTFDASMYDGTANFPLASALVWQTKAKLGWTFTRRLELTGSVGYEHFTFGQSPVVIEPTNSFCASGCIEPDSHTEQVTVMTGVAYHF